MTAEEAVAALDGLLSDDPEQAHGEAESILLAIAPPEVAEAYRRARDSVGFWYA